MYLRELLLGLRRRWYFVSVGLLLTVGLAVGATYIAPPQYTTTASLLLLPPKSALGTNGNPYLSLGGLGQALEVLATRLNATQDIQAMTKAHPDATISVEPDTTSTGPILVISVTSTSRVQATTLRDEITRQVPITLVAMQTDLGVRPYSQIGFDALASDPEPKRDLKNLLRAVIVSLALGAGLTFLGTGFLDSMLLRRAGAPVRRRRKVASTRAKSGSDVLGPAAVPATAKAAPANGTESLDWILPERTSERALTGSAAATHSS